MEKDRIAETLARWDFDLSAKKKRYIHFYSVRNFIVHFDNLPKESLKNKVLDLISNYIEEVEQNFFDYHGESSYMLYMAYVDKLSPIYSTYLDFKSFMTLRTALMVGVPIDLVLYFILRNSVLFYLPIVTFCLLLYYLYNKVFLEKKKKNFGLFY
jgi:hypothetical protein